MAYVFEMPEIGEGVVEGEGALTDLVESLFNVLSPRLFRCLQTVVDPEVNPLNWGVDYYLGSACGPGG